MIEGRSQAVKSGFYLRYPRSYERADEELESLELRLQDYQRKVGFGIHGCSHVFYGLNLLREVRGLLHIGKRHME